MGSIPTVVWIRWFSQPCVCFGNSLRSITLSSTIFSGHGCSASATASPVTATSPHHRCVWCGLSSSQMESRRLLLSLELVAEAPPARSFGMHGWMRQACLCHRKTRKHATRPASATCRALTPGRECLGSDELLRQPDIQLHRLQQLGFRYLLVRRVRHVNAPRAQKKGLTPLRQAWNVRRELRHHRLKALHCAHPHKGQLKGEVHRAPAVN